MGKIDSTKDMTTPSSTKLYTVHAKPGAKRASIEWMDEDTLKVSVCARPEKGRANEALIDLLAHEFHIKKTDIEIVRGHTTRIKHVLIKAHHPLHLQTKDYNG